MNSHQCLSRLFKATPIVIAVTPFFAASAWAQSATQLNTIEIRADSDAAAYSVPNATTATKTDTPIMETPLSIQIVPQQVLQDQKANTLDQALKNVSGIKSSNNSRLDESMYLRGFRSNVVFRDGFRIEDSFANGLQNLTNIDSVEVFKGPAAILYGRVEPGGIVNLVTKKPLDTPYYSAEQQIGSWDSYLTNLDATGPINADKTLLYRINVSLDKSKFWRDGVMNERQFIAPTLQWRPSARTQVTLEAQYNHNPLTYDSPIVPYDDTNKQFIRLPRTQNLTVHDQNPAVNDLSLLGVNWSHQINDDWLIKHQIVQHKVNGSYGGYYGVWGFEQVGPTSWTADRHRTSLEGTDTITSTDLNLTGHFDTAGLKHTLLLGADYYVRDMAYRYGYSSFPPSLGSVTDAFNPTTPTGVPLDPSTFSGVNNSTEQYGVYVQDQIKLPHDIQVLVGLRDQKVTHTGSIRDATDTVTPDATQDDHASTPRVGILWQPQNGFSLYGNYAENFGANNGRDAAGNILPAESAKQKEVGAKAEFYDGKLRVNLAFFDLTKTNVACADPLNPGFSIAVGEVQSKGAEFDIQGEIVPGWDVIATYTDTDIKVTKSTPGSAFTEGNRMSNVPQNMASFSTTYKFQQEALRGLKIGGGVIYRSSTTNPSNTIDTPGYSVFDAMASYEFKTGGNKVTAQLNIYNLFDKEYDMEMDAFGNVGILTYGKPRSITASLKYEF